MRVGAVLLLGVLLWSQSGLVERIHRTPLTPDERQALETSLAGKDFVRIEEILGNTKMPERDALLGALEFVGGRMRQAVQAFRKADAVKPLDDQDRFTLAMALVELNDGKGSRTELTRLNERHPDQPIYLYWLARLDYDARLYEAAVEKYKRVIRLDPTSVRGYDNLGLAYDMMGQPDDAQAAFSKAVELNRKLAVPSAWPPHNLGYLQLRQLQFQGAEANLREALQYDPKFALAHYHLGRALENEDKGAAAIEEYKSAAALDPKSAEPLYSLALLYRRRGDTVEAEKALVEYRKRKRLSGDSP